MEARISQLKSSLYAQSSQLIHYCSDSLLGVVWST